MEKPKVAKPKLELFGESLLTFFFFPNCLFVFSEQFSSFHIFPHFTPQVVGGGFPPILVQWTAFTLPLHPFFSTPSVEGVPFSFPSVEVVSSINCHLCLRFIFFPSSEWVLFLCLAQSLASGCLTREYYPNAEKGIL